MAYKYLPTTPQPWLWDARGPAGGAAERAAGAGDPWAVAPAAAPYFAAAPAKDGWRCPGSEPTSGILFCIRV